jgi:hypothetical protein
LHLFKAGEAMQITGTNGKNLAKINTANKRWCFTIQSLSETS